MDGSAAVDDRCTKNCTCFPAAAGLVSERKALGLLLRSLQTSLGTSKDALKAPAVFWSRLGRVRFVHLRPKLNSTFPSGTRA